MVYKYVQKPSSNCTYEKNSNMRRLIKRLKKFSKSKPKMNQFKTRCKIF